MKILSSEQIKQTDQFTIEHEPITSIDLMERAARACLFKILKYSDDETVFYIFCGKGNNGGDGLAIARMLAERKRIVEVFVVEHSEKSSEEFSTNFQRLYEADNVTIMHIHDSGKINFRNTENALIIDAILGSGTHKAVEGIIRETITEINKSGIPAIAIDVPTGLLPDQANEKTVAVMAFKTLTFQQPKLAFMFAENSPFVGDFEVLDIGLNQDFISRQATNYNFLTKSFVNGLMLARHKFSHKGSHGHALLIGGSEGKTGAILLASRACLRSGAGLLTSHIPRCGQQALQATLPEAMTIADNEEKYISTLPALDPFNAIGIGPGIGMEKQTQNMLKLLIQNSRIPLVIDADALNILSENKTWLSFLPKYSILTPHPKEFDRLAGTHTSGYDRLKSAQELAVKHQVLIVLKGAHSAIIMPDASVYFNSTGNPALAKGGNGDVLTGIITGLVARGYAPNYAAIIGVYLHGLAADIVIGKINPESVLPSDIIEKIGKAFDKLYS